MKKLSMLAALAATVVAAPALAQSYNPVTNGGPTGGQFQYGFIVNGSFTAFDQAYSGTSCPRIVNTSCLLRSPSDFLGAYFVAQDTATQGANLFSSDVTLHPGSGSELAVVRFTAPTTTSYNFSGLFRGVDTNGSGNGAIVTPVDSNGGNAVVFNNGVSADFDFTRVLGAGSTIDFTVGNNGNYSNDTTGLSLLVGAVPEPATWALMIMGFGAVGGAMRSRRSTKVAFAA